MINIYGIISSAGAKASAELYNKLGYNPYDCANDAIVDSNGNLTGEVVVETGAEAGFATGLLHPVSNKKDNIKAVALVNFIITP